MRLGFLTFALVAMFVAMFGAPIQAHTRMSESSPEDGALLTELPETFTLRFQSEVRLVMVMVRHDQGTIDVDDVSSAGFLSQIDLPLTNFGSGDYSVEWRGLARDGHVMTGTFTFALE